MKKSYIQFTAIILIAVYILPACSAATHAGLTYLQKPDKNEKNTQIWYNYWEDQLDAFEGNVVIPQHGEFSQIAIEAFQKAKMEWDDKVKTAGFNTGLLTWGCGIGAAILLLMIITGSKKNSY